MFPSFDLGEFLITMVALVLSITVHEFAHAFSAVKCGDDTPRRQGRISLNPIDHMDPMGTVMMVMSSLAGFGIGWGKPVQINSGNFRNPRWDNLKVSLWGPLSNLLVALAVGTLLRFKGLSMEPHMVKFLIILTFINISLAIFNLIPVAPLDGSHILSALLPIEQARAYDYFMMRNGMFVFLGLILLGNRILPFILGPPSSFLWHLFTGFPG